MRWKLLAVYLLLQVAGGLLALHVLVPLLTAEPEYQGEAPRVDFDFPSGVVGWTVAAGAVALFLLAPWSVFEYAGVLKHRPAVPMAAWVVGVALILSATLVAWTDEATARFSVITASAGIVTLIAAKHWPDHKETQLSTPPQNPPTSTAPAKPS